MAKINFHGRFGLNITRGVTLEGLNFSFLSKHGINYPYQLIYNSNNRLFVRDIKSSINNTGIEEILRNINTNRII